ncbi:cytochrome P450 CYP82D47-like protein, partial [Tanacetum coccineum]
MVISIIFSITVLSFIFRVFNKKRSNNGKHINPPQAKGAWPIIGHLHLLGGSQLPHKVLATLAETYGPIFTIKLGFRLALVFRFIWRLLETSSQDYYTRASFSTRVETLGHIRVSELQVSMKDIYESWVKNKEKENLDMVKMDMKHWFGNLILPDDEEGVRFQAVTNASEEDFPGFDHDTIIKSSCFGLLTAGLCWTFVMSRSQTKERKPAK